MQKNQDPSQARPRLAIIGGGISGLSAAYYLGKTGRFETVLYEKQARLGGHAHTETFEGQPFDTTVIAYHTEAYPTFAALIRELGLEKQTEVFRQELCFHSEGGGIDYLISHRFQTLLRHPLLAFKTLKSLQRFSRALVRSQRAGVAADLSMIDWLRSLQLPPEAIDRLILPMLHMFVGLDFAAIEAMPAAFLIDHLYAHKVLHYSSLSSWRSWKKGTATYVDALAREIQKSARIVTGASVRGVYSGWDGRQHLLFDDGAEDVFDLVLFATPPAPTRRLLLDPSSLEKAALDPWQDKELTRTIHRDTRLLPPRSARGFWNPYVKADRSCGASYLLYKLRAELPRDLVVSWQAVQPIDPARILAEEAVSISIYQSEALAKQKLLPLLNQQGHNRYYCGAHFYHGWHESGVVSGKEAAELLMALPQAEAPRATSAQREPAPSYAPA